APRLTPLCVRVGTTGVDVFFAISGFLITLLLLRELEHSGTLSLKRFYLRRALRLIPAYLAFLIVLFGLSRMGLTHVSERAWLGALTYTVNFHLGYTPWEGLHFWSLSAEEQFYLLWPPLLLLLRPKRARFMVLAYLAAAPALRLLLWIGFP